MEHKGSGLREAISIAEYDQAQAAAMEALADARAFLLVTGNERYELNAHMAVLNAPAPSFLVAATAVAAHTTSMSVSDGMEAASEENEDEDEDELDQG